MKIGIVKKSSIIFVCVFLMALFVYTGSALAFSSILSSFNSTYPGSTSGTTASCTLCHGETSTGQWNEYGWGLRQNGQNFAALEGLPSININGGTTNLTEINANTQPGWTTGSNNNLYNSSGLITSSQAGPGGIGDLDPTAANQPPAADPNGPYNGTVNVAVSFDGNGSSDPDGSIVAYDWDFGDGGTGTGATPSYTYTGDGTFTVTLTVTDDAGDTDSATTTAVIGLGNQAPIADPNGPYNGTVNNAVSFDGTGSSDPDGSIVSYEWDFGDGGTGTGATPSYTYTGDGTFTVTLTVTDDSGVTDSASTTASITLPDSNLPPTADPNGPYTGMPNTAVSFDGTGSSDPDGSIVAYDWDFGDGGTGTGATPSYTYTGDGTFTVTLTVTDDAGASNSASTTASITLPDSNLPPTADPNGPYNGTVNIAVSFDGTGSSDPDGSIVAFEWDFGDGGTGTGATPSYTYTGEGTFTVTLTVTDDAGDTNTATTTATIAGELGNQAPIADPNGPYNGTINVAVSFDGTGSSDPDGSIVAYDWDFGDGGTGTGATPTYTYSAEGTFNVTLTVTDDAGMTDSSTTTATIGIVALPEDDEKDIRDHYTGDDDHDKRDRDHGDDHDKRDRDHDDDHDKRDRDHDDDHDKRDRDRDDDHDKKD